jgi:CRISPR-associated endonuclease/helicase Cas3
LVCHAIDTAAVAELLVEMLLGPACRAELFDGLAPLGKPAAWAAVLCGLHDLGKFTPTFQALRDDVALSLLGEPAAADIQWLSQHKGVGRTDTFHGLLTAADLHRMLLAWGMECTTAISLASALGGHHGFFPVAAQLEETDAKFRHHGGAKWAQWRDRLVMELARLWGLPEPSSLPWAEVRVGLGAAVGLAGLASASDWIASDTGNFPYAGPEIDLTWYVGRAREQAKEAVRQLGWAPWRPPEDTSFRHLFPHADAPRPAQQVVERLVSGWSGPRILVVEAPTGEGKTKAALQCAARLVQRLGMAGMYVGMPTKASSNHLFGEISDFLDEHAAGLKARLLHSNADDHLAARALRAPVPPRTPDPSDVGRDEPADGQALAREWFTRKRGLLAPVATGTVDQALKAVIRSRHVFIGLAGLSGKVLVLDEVHAYDTYMSTLLDRLLWWAGRLGVPVILLSATLPSTRRSELVRSWCAGATRTDPQAVPALPTDVPYPRLTWSDGRHHRVEAADVLDLNAARIVALTQVSDEKLADWLLARIKEGGCAAVIHNLVSRATDTFTRLQAEVERLPEAERPRLLFITGRLAAGPRNETEQQLREAFGPSSTQRPMRAIVVGTQVLEQSLDLDFDVMVSDFAPVDSLIQRMGRLHRHRNTDRWPGVRTPVLALAGIDDTPSGPRFPRYTTLVYQLIVLLRTWVMLRGLPELRSPEDVSGLIDAVYGPPEAVACPPGWEQQWSKGVAALDRARSYDKDAARVMYLPQPYDDLDIATLTERPKSTRHTRRKDQRRR